MNNGLFESGLFISTQVQCDDPARFANGIFYLSKSLFYSNVLLGSSRVLVINIRTLANQAKTFALNNSDRVHFHICGIIDTK